MEGAVNSAAGRINGRVQRSKLTPMRYVNRPYSRNGTAGLYSRAEVGS